MATGGGGVGETNEALSGILLEWVGGSGVCKQSFQQTVNKGWGEGPLMYDVTFFGSVHKE